MVDRHRAVVLRECGLDVADVRAVPSSTSLPSYNLYPRPIQKSTNTPMRPHPMIMNRRNWASTVGSGCYWAGCCCQYC
jgi:hypothetical protein